MTNVTIRSDIGSSPDVMRSEGGACLVSLHCAHLDVPTDIGNRANHNVSHVEKGSDAYDTSYAR